MKNVLQLSLPAGSALVVFAKTAARLQYPPAPKGNQTDDFQGTKITDPCRGLENADAVPTQKWVDKESTLTASLLSKIPGREAIKTQLTALWNYEKFTGLFISGTA